MTEAYSCIVTWDIWHYFNFASNFLDKTNFNIEYPTGALVPMIIPRLLTSSYPIYVLLFHLQTIVITLLGVFLIKRKGQNYWAFLVSVMALFPITIERLDIYVAVLTLWAVLLFEEQKMFRSALVLLISILIKFYPIILVPYFILKKPRSAWLFILVGIASFLIINQNAFGINYHLERGVQPESIYASILFFKQNLTTTYAHSSFELEGVKFPLVFSAIFLILGFYKAVKSKSVFKGSFYLILGYIIGSKVFSPQYLVWLAVFLPFVKEKAKILTGIATILTGWYLGFYEQSVIKLIQPYVYILLFRNFLLLGAMI